MKNFLYFLLIFSLFYGHIFAFSVVGGLKMESAVDPGTSYTKQIQIKNETAKQVVVRVTLQDYLHAANGSCQYEHPEKNIHARSAVKWIKLPQDIFTIPANSTASCNYTVSIPDDASLIGSYWAAFIISEESDKLDAKKEGFTCGTKIQYAYLVVNHINKGKGVHNIKILSKELLVSEVEKKIAIAVENIGDFLLSPVLHMDVYDEYGKKIAKFTASKQGILPKGSVMYNLDVSSLKKGEYNAMVFLDADINQVFGLRYNFNL